VKTALFKKCGRWGSKIEGFIETFDLDRDLLDGGQDPGRKAESRRED
jgi:hypothetical protein